VLRPIEFNRIRGGKPFKLETPWFVELLRAIGQPAGAPVEVKRGGGD
jgi:pyrophosphate--fructose-6-phosphate 1-phosphotransferase